MTNAVWTTSSMDVGFIGFTVLPNRDIVIPPGATLKRFLIHQVGVYSNSEFDDYQQVNQLYMRQTVSITAGQYIGKELYRTNRRVPHVVTAFRDPIQILSYYTQIVGAGDQDLGANQKVSYGTADGPGFTIRLETSIQVRGPFIAFPVGSVHLAFSTLHLAP